MVKKVTFDQTLHNAPSAPFFTYEWHALWSNVLGKDWEPFCLIVDDAVIAPFARKNTEVIFSGGEEISDYQDLIGPDDAKNAAWPQILQFLKDHGASTIRLHNVPETSPTISFFRNLPGAIVEKEDTTPKFRLPASWEAYIKSLPYKDRHELRRKLRKFEREHPHTAIAESLSPQVDIQVLIDLMAKDKDKQMFLTPDMILFFQKLSHVFSKEISLLILTMDGKPAAATLSFIEDGVSFLYNSGFDRECCQNAGFYLKAMSIKRAIEKGLKEYNFLQGNERYKYELGGKDFFVYAIYLRL